ncbi:MAG: glycogen-binding domain-containing protein [bacterium]
MAATKGRKRVSFSIKADPNSEVYVAGSFNDWDARKNKLNNEDGTYKGVILLPPGRHEYKFIINDVWCIDPDCVEWAPNGFGSLNSVVEVK